jgi:regulator of replication initiation timing
MVKQATVQTTDIEPIDRLEDKIKLLVNMVTELRAAQTAAAEERVRLTRDIENLRSQLASAESSDAALTALRDERDVIRGRVADMLEHLEHLNL